MPPSALALVAAAALLHVGWNTLAKRARDPLLFLWSALALSGAALAPGLLRANLAELRSAAPYLLGSTLVHTAYFASLSRAYRLADLSLVYPVARGLAVALVPIAAWLISREGLDDLGVAGIAAVVAGIVVVGMAGSGSASSAASAAASRRGLAWAVATGLLIAAYSLLDRSGAQRMDPIAYVGLLGVITSIWLAPVVLRRRAALREEWRAGARTIVAAAVMTLGAYALVLFAFRRAPAGYVVACREMSIAVSVVIGRFWLGERASWGRAAGAAVIAAGVVGIAFARGG